MGVKPLTLALAATVLLVVVIGADATMNRSFALDLQAPSSSGSGTTWRTLAEVPYRYDDRSRAEPWMYGPPELEANRSDTLTFRVRAENGYFWPLDETFRAYHNGEEVASGRLSAPARGETESSFTVPADRILGRAPVPPDAKAPYIGGDGLQVRVDDESLDAYLTLREVSR